MDTILIVDDDHHLRQGFARLLTEEGYAVHAASSGEQALDMVKECLPHCVVMDIRMPGMDGLTALRELRQVDERLPVIMMTAFATTQTAIEATKLGAFDYILKPFDVPQMLTMIREAVDASHRMRARVSLAPDPNQTFGLNEAGETDETGGRGKNTQADASVDAHGDALVGRSSPMQALYKAIGRVAPTDALVLIRGESGTGKELVARAVYQHSLRAHKSFNIINCVAIPDTLLESELFGYEKGAFTGAQNRRIGKIEQAGGGTIFLDEIGDIPVTVQAKLLRLLQEKQIERLGGREPISVDVRILAATNADLERAVAEGRFREDLYYRLKVVSLHLPPLRDRREDVELLVRWFLARHARVMETPDPGIEATALHGIARYPWPGNVRELSNAVQKALVFNRGTPLTTEDFRQALAGPAPSSSLGLSPSPAPSGTTAPQVTSTTAGPANAGANAIANAVTNTGTRNSAPPLAGSKAESATPCALGTEGLAHIRRVLEQSSDNAFESLMDEMGRNIVREALYITGGNRSHAARLLGMSRPTLLARMEKYGLKIETHIY